MSTSQDTRPRTLLRNFSAALAVGLVASSGLFHAFGFDLMTYREFAIPCVVQLITGIECPGCGMTRALILVTHFEWGAAFRMNALVYLLLGFATSTLVLDGFRRSRATSLGAKLSEQFAGPALGLTLLHWAHRLAT